MLKKTIVFLLICFFIVFNLASQKKIYSLLILDSQSIEPYKTLREAMLSHLEKLGYMESNNILIDYDVLGNYEGRGQNILKGKLANNYDVIFLNGTIALKSAKDIALGSNNKFIYANVTDPVDVGVIEKIGVTPKYNFTGISYPVKVEERFRFIKKIFPKAKKIGYIYAAMPQSFSYKKWLTDMLLKEEFKDIEIVFREVEFVKGDNGTKRMALIAKDIITELDKIVDIFVSPNDQLGSSDEFAEMIYNTATKPLVGLAGENGSVISISPDLEANGKKVAEMIKQIFDGKDIKDIIPIGAEKKIIIDKEKLKKFKDLKEYNKIISEFPN